MNQYAGILLIAFVVAGFLITMLVLAYVLGPKHKTRTKQLPFECGSVSVGTANQRFNVRFYLVAMLFILFDIEVIFMYPWALVLEDIGWLAFIEMFSFMIVLLVGLIYVWKKGALDWRTKTVITQDA